jgi:hypothetical protein
MNKKVTSIGLKGMEGSLVGPHWTNNRRDKRTR